MFLMVRLSFWRSATFWHWQPGGMGFDQRWFLRDRSRDATASKAISLNDFCCFFTRWLHSLKTPVSSGCFLSSSCTYELSTDEGLKKAPPQIWWHNAVQPGAEGAFLFEKLASLTSAEQELVCLPESLPCDLVQIVLVLMT